MDTGTIVSLFAELKRRNVFRAAAAYVAVAWLLIQVAEATFPAFGLPEAALRTLILVLAVCFIPAVALSWAFELTPEGLKRDRDVEQGSELSIRTNRLLDRAIVTLLALGLTYFAFDKFLLTPHRQAEQLAAATEIARQEGRSEAIVGAYGDNSIAVLPFVNMSSDPEQEYLGDGIAEELLNLLARIPELRVISRSSAFSFKGRAVEIPEIARQLNVSHILEGSVRKSGNRIRITAQLIEGRSDTHLWSEVYDRTLDDIFAIQDQVAEEVAKQLHLALLGETPKAREADPVAYLQVLQARQIMLLQQHQELQRAEALLQQALAIDPDYVDALFMLQFVYLEQLRARDPHDPDQREQRETLAARVEEVRARVMALDPGNPQLKASVAFELLATDLSRAARLIEEAARTNPHDVFVLFTAARVAADVGKLDAAIRLGEYVAARDPLFFWAHLNLAQDYFDAGRTEEALGRFEIAVRLNPVAGAVRWKLGLAKLMLGDPEGAVAEFESEPEPVYRMHGLALAYHDLGRPEESAAMMAQLLPTEAEVWPFGMARAYAWMGNADQAFHFLERTAEQSPGYLGGVATNPLLRKLHEDPRWLPFLRSVGQAPAQLAAFEFHVEPPR
jgi:adenylate cyclase